MQMMKNLKKHDLLEKTEKRLGTLQLQQRKKAGEEELVFRHSKEGIAWLPCLGAGSSAPPLTRARIFSISSPWGLA